MLSTTLKRSVATLGVVAGLLAAAVPASAAPAAAGGSQPNADAITSLGREGSIECLLRSEGARPGVLPGGAGS